MNVRQILGQKPIQAVATISGSATLLEAAGVLASKKIGALVVSESGDSVDGILSRGARPKRVAPKRLAIPRPSAKEAEPVPSSLRKPISLGARDEGGYDDEGAIARGGTAVIHRVFERQLRRPEAMKILGDGVDPAGETVEPWPGHPPAAGPQLAAQGGSVVDRLESSFADGPRRETEMARQTFEAPVEPSGSYRLLAPPGKYRVQVVDLATGLNDVARFEQRSERRRRQAQRRQPRVVILDENVFFLRAGDLDLGGIADQQQLVTDFVGKGFQFSIAEIRPGNAIDETKHVTELVVDRWSDDRGRQGGRNRLDLAPEVVPDRAHVLELGTHVDMDHRDTSLGRTADEVQFRDLLDDFLQLVGDQLLDPFRARAGEARRHHRSADDEPGIFGPRHGAVGRDAERDEYQQRDQGYTVTLERRGREIHRPLHEQTQGPLSSLIMARHGTGARPGHR